MCCAAWQGQINSATERELHHKGFLLTRLIVLFAIPGPHAAAVAPTVVRSFVPDSRLYIAMRRPAGKGRGNGRRWQAQDELTNEPF